MTEQGKRKLAEATKRLEAALAAGSVSLVVGPQGSVAFRNWRAAERAGLTDLCAYRRLRAENSPALRRALARAEAIGGVKVNEKAVAQGVHSHDGGQSWGNH
ncbi:MAG: hypothetical protein OEW90_01795 [Betaproteobacteria bacterium]|nr:hypothetical protein [Betaproteobacteria bacterium]MDH4322852.1 hypothetical protein [Betaproteobacteria bacterium]MDH5210104.1 hypothetical protein [Betaproteobacteria bacterium]